MQQLIHRSIHFNKVILRLIFSHSFLMITFFGNLIIISFSLVFFALEFPENQSVQSVLDAMWWGFATATTVGYGDIIPQTAAGKIVGILLMLMGTALFATYTALFAQTILGDELLRYQKKSKEPKEKD